MEHSPGASALKNLRGNLVHRKRLQVGHADFRIPLAAFEGNPSTELGENAQ
jgi:hypothetical protein